MHCCRRSECNIPPSLDYGDKCIRLSETAIFKRKQYMYKKSKISVHIREQKDTCTPTCARHLTVRYRRLIACCSPEENIFRRRGQVALVWGSSSAQACRTKIRRKNEHLIKKTKGTSRDYVGTIRDRRSAMKICLWSQKPVAKDSTLCAAHGIHTYTAILHKTPRILRYCESRETTHYRMLPAAAFPNFCFDCFGMVPTNLVCRLRESVTILRAVSSGVATPGRNVCGYDEEHDATGCI
jgi:hypothetical protein